MASSRGLTTGETLAAWFVLILLASIVTPIYLRFQNVNRRSHEAGRMRRVYVAVALYQEDRGGAMPGSLAELGDLVETEDLVSSFDPYAGSAKSYPVEPTLPKLAGTVPYRISDAFLGNYIRSGKSPIKRWQDAEMQTGLLANVWLGEVRPLGNFEATSSGPILRVRMDGSLYTLPNRSKTGPVGDFADLFTKTAK
ncbi:MAG TPA: hypothetical protein VGE01_01615 [Fimbriimonas sp.]